VTSQSPQQGQRLERRKAGREHLVLGRQRLDLTLHARQLDCGHARRDPLDAFAQLLRHRARIEGPHIATERRRSGQRTARTRLRTEIRTQIDPPRRRPQVCARR